LSQDEAAIGAASGSSLFRAWPVDLRATGSWPKASAKQQEPIAKIEPFIANDNKGAAPFSWTATADSILAKLQHLCSPIPGR
jgi:hypothetical protein